ncbi:hypothetical protein HG531_007605 [Fusarium graminearum]|nr:hypothetical protein HG531_007605 [Fusarium graminearum]
MTSPLAPLLIRPILLALILHIPTPWNFSASILVLVSLPLPVFLSVILTLSGLLGLAVTAQHTDDKLRNAAKVLRVNLVATSTPSPIAGSLLRGGLAHGSFGSGFCSRLGQVLGECFHETGLLWQSSARRLVLLAK